MEAAQRIRGEDIDKKSQLIQLVGFKIGKELFGVDILMVQEIIRDARITAIPDSPSFIEGVINLRGNIIPVIDLRKRLNLFDKKKENEKNWIVIIDVSGRVTGFIVDTVTKVLKVDSTNISLPPDLVVAGLKSQYIKGVCQVEKNLLILLDFNSVLLIDEIKRLKSMKRERKETHIVQFG